MKFYGPGGACCTSCGSDVPMVPLPLLISTSNPMGLEIAGSVCNSLSSTHEAAATSICNQLSDQVHCPGLDWVCRGPLGRSNYLWFK